MKKIYIKPKLTAIELDHRQATLAVCKVGGMYMGPMGKCYYTGESRNQSQQCQTNLISQGTKPGHTANQGIC